MNTDEIMEMIDTVNKLSLIVKQLTIENKKLHEARDSEYAKMLELTQKYEDLKFKYRQMSDHSGGGGFSRISPEARDGAPGRGGGVSRADGRVGDGVLGGRDARASGAVPGGRDDRASGAVPSAYGGSASGAGSRGDDRGDRGDRGDRADNAPSGGGDRAVDRAYGRDGGRSAGGSTREEGYVFMKTHDSRCALTTAVGGGARKIPEARDAGGGAVGDGRAGGRTDDRSGDSRTFARESKEIRLEASDDSHGTRLRDMLDKSPLAMVTSGDNKNALTDMETRTKRSMHTILTGFSLDPKTDRAHKESHTNDHGGASSASGAIGRDRVRFRFGQNEEHEY